MIRTSILLYVALCYATAESNNSQHPLCTPRTQAPTPEVQNPTPTTEAPVPQPSELSAPSAAMTAEQQEIFDYVNDERRQRGLQELTPVDDLVIEAQRWAMNMSTGPSAGAYFLHRDPLDMNIVSNWVFLGENIGRGSNLPLVHQGLMNSQGHRENILSPRFTRLGVGVAFNYNQFYVCQIFMED